MGIIHLQHSEHPEEYALELEAEDMFVIIRFEPDGVEVAMPPAQQEKWDALAEREGKTVEQVVMTALSVAFAELDDGQRW